MAAPVVAALGSTRKPVKSKLLPVRKPGRNVSCSLRAILFARMTQGKSPAPVDVGLLAWGGLAVYIAIYDLVAIRVGQPTMSASFHRMSLRRLGRPGLVLFWAYLTGHLFRWLPERADLFRRFGL